MPRLRNGLIGWASGGAIALALVGGVVVAASHAQAAQSASVAAESCRNPRALGVSRVIEIDTTKQTHFGTQQYGDQPDLLRDGEVVLTFDDGPLRRKTRKVLRALARHCTKATFFAVGRMAVADPRGAREMADGGHTIGHHTWSHRNQKTQSLRRAIAEFELGLSAIEAAIGRPSAPFFRFPYLADAKRMQRYITQRKFGIFSIDIDSYDWRSKSASRVYSQVMRRLQARRKGIVLFHDIQTSTANSLDRLLDQMKAEGFKIVHFVPKAKAVTLPEYDEDAAARLEKRSYRRHATPFKTAFKFVDPGRGAGKTRERRKVTPTSVRLPKPQVSIKPKPQRKSQTRAKPRPVKVQRAAPSAASKPVVRRRPSPDWRSTIHSGQDR